MLHKKIAAKTCRGRLFKALRRNILVLSLCLTFATSFCFAANELDTSKYIPLDQVKAGMKGYCLTVYKGTVPERFELEVVNVARNIMPGRNAILIEGLDERFIHTGPVAGCSGSPVYIDGRLAGALAFAWPFSKDPLYGVTPIEEMLRVGQDDGNKTSAGGTNSGGFIFDFSKPLNFDQISKQMAETLTARKNTAGGAAVLPCPLVVSGLSSQTYDNLNSSLEPLGFMAVAGLAGAADSNKFSDLKLVPGGCLAVPLVSGDIKMEAIGTVTEIAGDKVYGFGHSFLGYGAVDLPMATGQIYTVVSNLMRSFKAGGAIEVVGALTADESSAVFGRIGAKAKTIPLTIRVERYNDPQKRTYNCRLATNQIFTPMVLPAAVEGAALMRGNLPPDHMIEYDVNIGVKGGQSISFKNVSTTLGLMEVGKEGGGSVALLMNNPYERMDITSVDFNIRIVPKNIISHIWSVDAAETKVKAGKEVTLDIVVESYLAGKKKYRTSLTVPSDLPEGRYDLSVMGGYAYRDFLTKTEPFRFVAMNMPNLISAINDYLNIRKDKLYCVLVLPAAGLTVEKAELPDLPATKALLLADSKRTLKTQSYPHWVEKDIDTGTVVIDSKTMQITVEKQK